MDRAELERLDRESLIRRAQSAGIKRARVLTRPELVDELLRLDPTVDESQLKKTRGFFGLARDLLNRVVERGLHLPDAAERIRAALGTATLRDPPRPDAQAVPTVTLAEIYAAQGHRRRAIDTLERVLELEPDHGAARSLLERLLARDYVDPNPPLPPEAEEPPPPEIGADLGTADEVSGLLDELERHEAVAAAGPVIVVDDPPPDDEAVTNRIDEIAQPEPQIIEPSSVDQAAVTARGANAESPEVFAVEAPDVEAPRMPTASDWATDEIGALDPSAASCVGIPLGRSDLYVWWIIPDGVRRRFAGGRSRFVVRTFIAMPTWDGPDTVVRDMPCAIDTGELVVQGLPTNALVRVAVGFVERGAFRPVAHGPMVEVTPSGDVVEWTLEAGVRPAGEEVQRVASIASRVVRLTTPDGIRHR